MTVMKPDLTKEEIKRREGELLDCADRGITGPIYHLTDAIGYLATAAQVLALITLYRPDLLYTDFDDRAGELDIYDHIEALAGDAKKLLARVRNMLPTPAFPGFDP
jgi:hypothetical protein